MALEGNTVTSRTQEGRGLTEEGRDFDGTQQKMSDRESIVHPFSHFLENKKQQCHLWFGGSWSLGRTGRLPAAQTELSVSSGGHRGALYTPSNWDCLPPPHLYTVK